LESEKQTIELKKKEMEKAKKSAVKASLSVIRERRACEGISLPTSPLNGPTAPTTSPKRTSNEARISEPILVSEDDNPAKLAALETDDEDAYEDAAMLGISSSS
jgi:hypothetical protein